MNMTIKDEELLSQYLDGELSTPQAQQLEQRLEVEPQLQPNFLSMRKMNESLKNTFHTPRARTVPARIINMLTRSDSRPVEASANVVPFPARTRKASWGFAIAASIMAASGLLLVQGTGQQFADQAQGVDALLAHQMENTPSRGDGWNVLSDGREIRPVLTYARIGGGWCREYLLSSETGHSRGIACRREEGTWMAEVLDEQAQQLGSADEYRAAGANDSNKVAIFMGENAADIALSAEQEQELITSRWQ